MPSKGGSGFRTSHSSLAYAGSGGISGNTLLKKYSSPRANNLENIVSNSYNSIDEKLEERAKTALKYFAPGLYQGLAFIEFLYKHRNVIIRTIDNVAQIWSDGTSPVSEKIFSTVGEVAHGGVDIARKELKDNWKSYVASAFSQEAVKLIEERNIIDTVANEIDLPGHKERFKDLLEDTIEKQTEEVLQSFVEGKNE